MDVDSVLRDTGERWRRSQAPGQPFDVQALVDVRRPGGRQWRLVGLAAAVAVACVAAVGFLFQQALAPATGPARPAAPVTTPASITSEQLIGTWYSSVSVTVARHTYRALVGDWSLTLRADGSARLSRLDGADAASGSWRLSGNEINLDIPFIGCTVFKSTYHAGIAPLHGLLELVSADRGESCQARSIVLDGHWSASATGAG